MPSADIELEFPNIKGGYRITSPETSDYNCFAWALGKDNDWYSPAPFSGYQWPNNLANNTDPETMEELFRREAGYHPCENGSVESGFEKIALYLNNKKVTHAPDSWRQAPGPASSAPWRTLNMPHLMSSRGRKQMTMERLFGL